MLVPQRAAEAVRVRAVKAVGRLVGGAVVGEVVQADGAAAARDAGVGHDVEHLLKKIKQHRVADAGIGDRGEARKEQWWVDAARLGEAEERGAMGVIKSEIENDVAADKGALLVKEEEGEGERVAGAINRSMRKDRLRDVSAKSSDDPDFVPK